MQSAPALGWMGGMGVFLKKRKKGRNNMQAIFYGSVGSMESNPRPELGITESYQGLQKDLGKARQLHNKVLALSGHT